MMDGDDFFLKRDAFKIFRAIFTFFIEPNGELINYDNILKDFN